MKEHGRFRKGYDPRRHQLTQAERRRGGRTRWARIMVELRRSMGLSIPLTVWQEARLPIPDSDVPF